MDSSEKTRHLQPVFVGAADGQDIKSLLYVRDEKGAFKSLAELYSSYQVEESAELPGIATTDIVETSSERGTTVESVSTSPYRLCCVYVSGVKICFPC